jgi:hypothetical protein
MQRSRRQLRRGKTGDRKMKKEKIVSVQ